MLHIKLKLCGVLLLLLPLVATNVQAGPSTYQLTQNGNSSSEYSLATNGESAAYARINSPSGTRDIIIQNLRTKDVKVIDTLAGTRDPNIHMDKDTVVWDVDDGTNQNVIAYDIKTNEKKTLSGDYPAFESSLDKNLVSWIGFKNGQRDLFLYNLQDGTTRQLTSDSTSDAFTDISKDKIVFTRYVEGYRNVFVYDLGASSFTQISHLDEDASNPAISSDLVTWNTATKVYLYNLKDKSTKVIDKTSDSSLTSAYFNDVNISEGSVLIEIQGFSGNNFQAQLYLYDVKAAATTRITVGRDIERDAALAKDVIVFVGSNAGFEDPDIFVISK
jgi:hypothetical protein